MMTVMVVDFWVLAVLIGSEKKGVPNSRHSELPIIQHI
jgi:hypothetical protein